jgi:hypothetical protein
MPAYDAMAFHPPAPAALVTARSAATQRAVHDIPMLLDTGADVTLLPRGALGSLIPGDQELPLYQLTGFDGTRSIAPAIQLELEFLGKRFHGRFLLIEDTRGILGRNVLNAFSLLLDGPAQSWRELQPPSPAAVASS